MFLVPPELTADVLDTHVFVEQAAESERPEVHGVAADDRLDQLQNVLRRAGRGLSLDSPF